MSTQRSKRMTRLEATGLMAVAIDATIMFWLVLAGYNDAFSYLLVANSALFFVIGVTLAIKFYLDTIRGKSRNYFRPLFLIITASASLYIGLPVFIRLLGS